MYYEKDDYNRALPLFEELSTAFRGSAKAEEVNYYYAYCHYSLGEYLMAAYLFETYAQTYLMVNIQKNASISRHIAIIYYHQFTN